MTVNDDKFLKAFGLHLQDIREGKKIRKGESISLRILEQLSNVDYSQIHRIEKGKTAPSITTMRKLANALGISLADLVTFEE
jgi:transcriptional regulator with XRE-family HTH domain